MGASFITTETKACNLPDTVPKGWHAPYFNPADFVIGIDTMIKHTGRASAFIERTPSASYGNGFIFQEFAAGIYRNKRVRFTIYIKSNEVEIGVLWFKAEGPENVLNFGNNHNNLIEGTNDWTMYRITLDIPEETFNVQFGIMLIGQGKLWVDDCNLEIVNDSIPSDNVVSNESKVKYPKKTFPPVPIAMNLGFEDY